MNILITDIVFPNKYAVWRNVEIQSFIERYSADILVNCTKSYAGINYDIDYEFINSTGILHGYEFLIFDPNYNYLNRYNTHIDGTAFNNQAPYSYLLTKKGLFDIDSYDLVYHIFLNVYNYFNKSFNFPLHKQIIHLYPGGGYDATNLDLPPSVHIVSSSPITSNHIASLPNNSVDCWLGPFMLEGEQIPHRPEHLSKETITVCFASMGGGIAKGDRHYLELVRLYTHLYPKDMIRFISIGNCSPHPQITNYPAMDYKALGEFYAREVDIFVNLETGQQFNGWPLGIEAAKQGAVLISTDSYNQRPSYTIDDDTIPVCDSVIAFVHFIHSLVHDRTRMERIKQNFRIFALRHLSFDAQQRRVFTFLEQIHVQNQSGLPVQTHPTDSESLIDILPISRLRIINNTINYVLNEYAMSQQQLKTKTKQLQNTREVAQKHERQILSNNNRIQLLENNIKELEQEIAQKNEHIHTLEEQIKSTWLDKLLRLFYSDTKPKS